MEKTLPLKKNAVRTFKNSYLSYFTLYLFYYLSWALFSSLISVYLLSQGYTAAQASLVVSASFLASLLFQPAIGRYADRAGMKKSSTRLLLLAGLGGLLFLASRRFWLVLISYSFVMCLLNGTNPVMEKICTAAPFPYGRIRIWGTIGYAAGTQLAGLLHNYVAPAAIFAAFLFTMLVCLAGAQAVEPAESTPDSPVQPETPAGFAALFHNRPFVMYLLLAGLFYGATTASHTFVPALLQAGGMEASLVGTVLSLAVLCELPLILFSGRFMDRIPSKTLALTALVLALVQVAVCALPVPAWLQVPVLFVSKHPAGMLFIMLNLKIVTSLVEPGQLIRALALVATIKNLTSMALSTLTGTLIDAAGYPSAFAGLAVVLGLALLLLSLSRLPAGPDQKLFS